MVEHLWLTGLGIYDLMGGTFISLNGGAFMAYWVGHFMAFWVGHLSLNGQGSFHLMSGALWFNRWGTYGLNGCDSNGKLLFRLEVCSKMLVFRGVPFSIIA